MALIANVDALSLLTNAIYQSKLLLGLIFILKSQDYQITCRKTSLNYLLGAKAVKKAEKVKERLNKPSDIDAK